MACSPTAQFSIEDVCNNPYAQYNDAILMSEVTLTSDSIDINYKGASLANKGFIMFTGYRSVASASSIPKRDACGNIIESCNTGCITNKIYSACNRELIFYNCREDHGDGNYTLGGLVRGVPEYGCNLISIGGNIATHSLCEEIKVNIRTQYFDCAVCNKFGEIDDRLDGIDDRLDEIERLLECKNIYKYP